MARLGSQARAEELLLGRLDDLVTGLASTGADERLQFARQVVARQGIDPTTPDGRERAKVYLVEARARVLAENERYLRTAKSAQQLRDRDAALAAYTTVYQDRGLSSDTSLRADFGIERALQAIKSSGRIEAGARPTCRHHRTRTRFYGQSRRLRFLSPADDPAVRSHRFAVAAWTGEPSEFSPDDA